MLAVCLGEGESGGLTRNCWTGANRPCIPPVSNYCPQRDIYSTLSHFDCVTQRTFFAQWEGWGGAERETSYSSEPKVLNF